MQTAFQMKSAPRRRTMSLAQGKVEKEKKETKEEKKEKKEKEEKSGLFSSLFVRDVQSHCSLSLFVPAYGRYRVAGRRKKKSKRRRRRNRAVPRQRRQFSSPLFVSLSLSPHDPRRLLLLLLLLLQPSRSPQRASYVLTPFKQFHDTTGLQCT